MTDSDHLPALAGNGRRHAVPSFLIPQSFEQIEAIADKFCEAGWVPKSYTDQGRPNKAAVEVGIMAGLTIGLHPLAALQSIAVINGMPSLWGDGMLAVVRDSGLMEEFDEKMDGQGEELTAYCTVKRRGEKPIERKFTVAMAKKASLLSKQGPWQSYPQRMLTMRARSWALRDAFTDVLRGMRSAEELMDGGDLVEGADGVYVPAERAGPPTPRPERADFDPEPEDVYTLVDVAGEVIGEHGPAVFSGTLMDMLEGKGPHSAKSPEAVYNLMKANADEVLRLRESQHREGCWAPLMETYDRLHNKPPPVDAAPEQSAEAQEPRADAPAEAQEPAAPEPDPTDIPDYLDRREAAAAPDTEPGEEPENPDTSTPPPETNAETKPAFRVLYADDAVDECAAPDEWRDKMLRMIERMTTLPGLEKFETRNAANIEAARKGGADAVAQVVIALGEKKAALAGTEQGKML